MPPLKQPVKLFDGSLTTLNKCIIESCQYIEKTCGKYRALKCQEAVQEIQDYLLASLPYHLLESMCNKIHSILTEYNSVDNRIISSVFIHKNCQKFNPKFELVPDNGFWISKVYMLEKIVILNLKMVCTDDVLQIVGAKCRLLEYINIVSRISSLHNSSNNFNALKLKFFVSDVGLKFLSECKNLKRIEMTRILRSQCAGSKITHSGICSLLRSLPKLEVISYSDLGSVIDEIDTNDTLSLTSICDYHPKPQRILKFSSLCPYLTELCLHVPTDFSVSKNVSDDILINLSKSNLQLESLDLINFFLNDSFNEFIKEKGKYLINLYLSKHASVSGVIDAVMLGYHCQNIENLHLASVGISQVNLEMIENKKRKSIYKNLKCLTIYSRDIDFNDVLPVFLNNAINIVNITIDNYGQSVFIDKPLQGVMNSNPLNDLQKAFFYRGIFLSFDFLVKFTLFCPRLKYLTVHDCALLTEKNLEDFKGDLKIKNYDINITLLQLTSL